MKLCKPNLPVSAEYIIIGERYGSLLAPALDSLGISALWLPDNTLVDTRLSGHADLSAINTPDKGLLLAPYLRKSPFVSSLDGLGIAYGFADISQGNTYPADAGLNICSFGEVTVCNPKTAYMPATAGNVIPVKQGYSRCSVCVVSEKAVITADKGIASALENTADVLVISQDGVVLDGFDCGFIGGAAFKVSSDKLCFSGCLDRLPDKAHILDFLDRHGVSPVYLTDSPLFDFGGAVPITEK